MRVTACLAQNKGLNALLLGISIPRLASRCLGVVMLFKMVSVAVLAIVAGCGGASAQSANDFGGPKERPPASFTGQQYVDSRGCVFLRAGFGGQINWVPRVRSDRRQLCGYPPTLGPKTEIATADPVPTPAPAPKPLPVAKPAAPVLAQGTKPQKAAPPLASYVPPPVVMAAQPPAPSPRRVATHQAAAPAPRGGGAERVASVGMQGKIGCYADAPKAERFRLQGGGAITLCTSGNGDLTNARPPRVLGGPAAVAASGYLEERHVAPRQVAVSTQDQPVVPKGYKLAWQDGRLNTQRGVGTAQGWAEQDHLWTRKHPARLVADTPKRKKIVYVPAQVSMSSMTTPSTMARAYVQVGTFGQPANAAGASARLAGLGLPVAQSRIIKFGKALQIVMAGPFASVSEAQAALGQARKAGFVDAFIR
jgi:hypothetical protein